MKKDGLISYRVKKIEKVLGSGHEYIRVDDSFKRFIDMDNVRSINLILKEMRALKYKVMICKTSKDSSYYYYICDRDMTSSKLMALLSVDRKENTLENA